MFVSHFVDNELLFSEEATIIFSSWSYHLSQYYPCKKNSNTITIFSYLNIFINL